MKKKEINEIQNQANEIYSSIIEFKNTTQME